MTAREDFVSLRGCTCSGVSCAWPISLARLSSVDVACVCTLVLLCWHALLSSGAFVVFGIDPNRPSLTMERGWGGGTIVFFIIIG